MAASTVEFTETASNLASGSDSSNKPHEWTQLLLSIDDQQLQTKKDDIIQIIGGIGNILNIFTTNNLINENQMYQLYQLLSDKSSHSISKATSTVSVALSDAVNSNNDNNLNPEPNNTIQVPPALERQITENVKKQQKYFKVYLNQQNDFWHYLLPEEKHVFADKIVTLILHSKWSYVMIVFLFSLSMLCRWAFPLYQSIPATLCIVWFMCFLLTFNISMIKRMMQSFVFWFKLYNWIVFIICYILLFNAPILMMEFTNWIAGTLAIAAVSMHDGCTWSNRVKTCTGFLIWICLIAIYGFVYFEGKSRFFGDHWRFNDATIVVFDEPISIKSNCLNALFNLQLFIGKQVLSMIKYKKKASVLSIRPYIVWCDNAAELKNKLAFHVQPLESTKNIGDK